MAHIKKKILKKKEMRWFILSPAGRTRIRTQICLLEMGGRDFCVCGGGVVVGVGWLCGRIKKNRTSWGMLICQARCLDMLIPVWEECLLLVLEMRKLRLAVVTWLQGQSAALLMFENLCEGSSCACPPTPPPWDLFSSRGNWMGAAPYKTGRPCSACPPTYQGSCSSNMCISRHKSSKLLWLWIFPGLRQASSWAWCSKRPFPKTGSRNTLLRTWVGLTPPAWICPPASISWTSSMHQKKTASLLSFLPVTSFSPPASGKEACILSWLSSQTARAGRSSGSGFWTLRPPTRKSLCVQ